jgi:uncharacterized protein (TIGR02246 family)
MTRRILLGLAALALVAPHPAAAQAGAGDLKSQIAKMDQAWQTAYNAKDVTALAALYAEDGKVMAPGYATVSGRAAIQEFFAEQVKQGGQNTVTTGEVLDGGTIAVATGGWVATGADGKHLGHGTYVTVYKKVGGNWMIYRDTWNSSMAM